MASEKKLQSLAHTVMVNIIQINLQSITLLILKKELLHT